MSSLLCVVLKVHVYAGSQCTGYVYKNPISYILYPILSYICESRFSPLPVQSSRLIILGNTVLFSFLQIDGSVAYNVFLCIPGILASSVAQSATGCVPSQRSVSLPSDPDPNVIYYPMCTTITRCGGCCAQQQHECAATRYNVLHVSVSPSPCIQIRKVT